MPESSQLFKLTISWTLDRPLYGPKRWRARFPDSQSIGFFFVKILQRDHLLAASEDVEELNDKLHYVIWAISRVKL